MLTVELYSYSSTVSIYTSTKQITMKFALLYRSLLYSVGRISALLPIESSRKQNVGNKI